MTGNIAFITMTITWIAVFLYITLTFGTPIIAGLLALASQAIVLILTLLLSEILNP
jgi:hypothetical protein